MKTLQIIWITISFLGLNTVEPVNTAVTTPANLDVETLYSQLEQKSESLPSRSVFEKAYAGWEYLKEDLDNPLLTVIDFSLPSTEKRLWIIDVDKGKVMLHSVVSHGRNSGNLYAEFFSNTLNSYKSSLGFYKTAETYEGKHGYSLRLDGLEKGFNDQARKRAIVIHGADYAREEFVKINGRLGRSLGCPALPSEISGKVIDLIKNGSLIFVYGEDKRYLISSPLLSEALIS